MNLKPQIIAVAIITVIAGTFAVLWYGASVENGALKRELDAARGQIQDLQRQLTARSEELQKTTAQLLDVQGKLQTTQQQLDEANRRLEQTRRELESTTAQLQDVQNRLRDAQSQIQDLARQRDQLIRQRDALEAEIKALNATTQKLREKIYSGRNYVEKLKLVLSRIMLKAPQVGYTWNFTRTHVYSNLNLSNGRYDFWVYWLTKDEVVEIRTSENLKITVYRLIDYVEEKRPLAEGRGYLRFTSPSNETYFVVISNDLGRNVIFNLSTKYIQKWHYYDTPPPSPQRPYVVGAPGVPSRDIFRMYAIYNYWLENREALAAEVEKQLGAAGNTAFQPAAGSLDKHTLYALSLAALLKDAGFDVSFAAVGNSWENPLAPSSAIVRVKFISDLGANSTVHSYSKALPIGTILVRTQVVKRPTSYETYVLIDTYNIVNIVDKGLSTTEPYNVIFIDGLTTLE